MTNLLLLFDLFSGITSRIEHIILNGDEHSRLQGNLNFSFAYVEGESLLMVGG